MQQCGFCSMMSGLLRRAMCIGSRRGSTESYYRELGDQDTLKIEDKSSDFCEESDELPREHEKSGDSSEAELFEISMMSPIACTGRFLTMHKRRKKRLTTKSLVKESGLLDDLLPGQVQCILDRSAEWNFNAFTLENVSGGRCLPVLCIHLFHIYGLITYFKLDVVKVWRLFSLIEEGYHSSNPYHNSIHATDVTQAMHCFLQQKQIRDHLEPLEIMSSLIAAIAHDVDHPGVNQPFLIATSNHLAALYKNTSVLENHHWRMAVSCLIESRLTHHLPTLQMDLERQINSLILATDITRQQEYLSQFKAYLDTNTLDLTKGEHRLLVLQIALKCADISNPCRPWEISRKWSLKVCDEFFRQGDYERKLNLPVTALCDRHTISIPKIQTGFLKFVVAPLIAEWHRFLHNELSSQMSQNLLYNQCKWEMLLAQEIAEETRTEISEAELVEDELDTSPDVNMSESAEQLLPLRRGSLNPAQAAPTGSRDHLRRFSVPLNVFQDTKFKSRERGSRAESPIAMCSDHSLHSQLSLGEQCEHAGPDPDPTRLSTECLRPDSSIASITTPRQATRLSCVLKDGPGWKLKRQQTFPPLETGSRPRPAARHVSDEDAIYHPSQHTKTEYGQNFTDTASGALSDIYKKNDSDKTDNEDASENKVDIGECSSNLGKEEEFESGMASGRRGPAPEGGGLLRHNLSANDLRVVEEAEGPLLPPHSRQLRRRKSMPTERLSTGKECWSQRRGSAPAPVESSQLRGLASRAAARLGANGGRRKPNPITSCQQWLAKTTYTVQERTTQMPRRSSLPVEIPQVSEPTKPSETK